MRKFSEGTYALGALTIFAFWLFAGLPFLYLSWPQETRANEQWLVVWTAVLAFATVGLIGATCLLGYFSFRQLRDTDRALRVTQRAYITVEPLGLHPISAKKLTVGHFRIRNAGNLPARNLGWFVDYKIIDDPAFNSFPTPLSDDPIIKLPAVAAA
jgi:hypothetical protein